MSFSPASSSSSLTINHHHHHHHQDAHPHTSWFRQLLNLLGCFLIFPLYRAAAVNTLWPATVDLLISICLAELCRFTNEGRRIAWRALEAQPRREKEDVEKGGFLGGLVGEGSSGDGVPLVAEAMASIVGWREDPDLWERCLESYKEATGCRFVLVGIDGHDADDKEMVDIFKKVLYCVSIQVGGDSFLVKLSRLARPLLPSSSATTGPESLSRPGRSSNHPSPSSSNLPFFVFKMDR